MKPLYSCAESLALEGRTRASAALPSCILMEDASLRIWDCLAPIAASLKAGTEDRPLVALCGSGNNGGDALALLRQARFAGLRGLAAIVCGKVSGEAPALYAASLAALGLPLLSWTEEPQACTALLNKAALLVDGIAGSGLRGVLRESAASLAAAVRHSAVPVASIDIPSGLGEGLADALEASPALSFAELPFVSARWTIAIEPAKTALYFPALRPFCGTMLSACGVFPAEAGLDSRAWLLEPADLDRLLPPCPPDLHKGLRGSLAVFAGSPGCVGAAILASRSGLAAGAGLVALFASADILPILAAGAGAVMVKPEPESPGSLEAGDWKALLAGPGWGLGPRLRDIRLAALGRLLESGLPMLLDADAIGLFAELFAAGARPRASLVLTPHPGEFEKLTGLPARLILAEPSAFLSRAAEKFGAVIALKSHVTWIAAPDGRIAVWDGMEPALATAGSGDVLAGLCAGLLARGMDPFDAAQAAVILHGMAGRGLRSSCGWFEAGALIPEAARLAGGAA